MVTTALSGSLVGRADRKIDTTRIADQWDRLGHFYASLESGHATALDRATAAGGRIRREEPPPSGEP